MGYRTWSALRTCSISLLCMVSGQARNSPAVWSFWCYYMACTLTAIWHLTLFILCLGRQVSVPWSYVFGTLWPSFCSWSRLLDFILTIAYYFMDRGLPGIDIRVWLHILGVSSRRITPVIQFFSSVCVCLFVCLPGCLPACLPAWLAGLAGWLAVCLFWLSVLSLCLSVRPSLPPSLPPSLAPSVGLSVCLSVRPSVRLSVCLSLSLCGGSSQCNLQGVNVFASRSSWTAQRLQRPSPLMQHRLMTAATALYLQRLQAPQIRQVLKLNLPMEQAWKAMIPLQTNRTTSPKVATHPRLAAKVARYLKEATRPKGGMSLKKPTHRKEAMFLQRAACLMERASSRKVAACLAQAMCLRGAICPKRAMCLKRATGTIVIAQTLQEPRRNLLL